MGSEQKPSRTLRNSAIVVVAIVIVVGATLAADPSIIQGSMSNASHSTSSVQSTSSLSSSSGVAQIAASAVSCSGSGTTETCKMTLTNSGSAGTSITGEGPLAYNEAGGMGVNEVTTTAGCTSTSGGLGSGQSESVSCAFAVNKAASSGEQLSGTVALSNGNSVAFSATAP